MTIETYLRSTTIKATQIALFSADVRAMLVTDGCGIDCMQAIMHTIVLDSMIRNTCSHADTTAMWQCVASHCETLYRG